jgi:hypothetical protein
MGPFDNDNFWSGGDFTLPTYDTSDLDGGSSTSTIDTSGSSGGGISINLGGLADKLKDGINNFTGSLEPVKVEHRANDQTILLIGLAVLCLIMNKK